MQEEGMWSGKYFSGLKSEKRKKKIQKRIKALKKKMSVFPWVCYFYLQKTFSVSMTGSLAFPSSLNCRHFIPPHSETHSPCHGSFRGLRDLPWHTRFQLASKSVLISFCKDLISECSQADFIWFYNSLPGQLLYKPHSWFGKLAYRPLKGVAQVPTSHAQIFPRSSEDTTL